jgi:quercetin dioxygenase-like cupin family protein
MRLVHLDDAPDHDEERFVATEFLQGTQCNVRVIKLVSGQDLPPHTHEPSDLMLYVAEGEAELTTDDGTVPFPAGSLAFLEGTETLRVGNRGDVPVTLLAFLTPAFPPPG